MLQARERKSITDSFSCDLKHCSDERHALSYRKAPDQYNELPKTVQSTSASSAAGQGHGVAIVAWVRQESRRRTGANLLQGDIRLEQHFCHGDLAAVVPGRQAMPPPDMGLKLGVLQHVLSGSNLRRPAAYKKWSRPLQS